MKNGDDHSLSILNQQLKRKVDEVNPTANTPPLDAGSPDTKIGVINIPRVQQQYGKNFGNSVIPFRPPPPVFAPLGGHGDKRSPPRSERRGASKNFPGQHR